MDMKNGHYHRIFHVKKKLEIFGFLESFLEQWAISILFESHLIPWITPNL